MTDRPSRAARAPRPTRHPWVRFYDFAANALHTWMNVRHMPPDQLLRQVFESCVTYTAAKDVVENAGGSAGDLDAHWLRAGLRCD
jgi:hypothetical protein